MRGRELKIRKFRQFFLNAKYFFKKTQFLVVILSHSILKFFEYKKICYPTNRDFLLELFFFSSLILEISLNIKIFSELISNKQLCKVCLKQGVD